MNSMFHEDKFFAIVKEGNSERAKERKKRLEEARLKWHRDDPQS